MANENNNIQATTDDCRVKSNRGIQFRRVNHQYSVRWAE